MIGITSGQQSCSAFMPQERDFRFDASGSGKPCQTLCAHHPVAGDDDRDRVAATGAPNRSGRCVQCIGNLAIAACIPKRDLGHLGTDRLLKASTSDAQWQIELLQPPIVIGAQLGGGLNQQRVIRPRTAAPVQPGDRASFGGDGQYAKAGLRADLLHPDQPCKARSPKASPALPRSARLPIKRRMTRILGQIIRITVPAL